MTKCIIAGGRDFTNYDLLESEADKLAIVEVVSGLAKGADELGFNYAVNNGIGIKEFPADWDKFGRGAGHIRNKQMGDYADVLLAFWDGKSTGTANMIDYMNKLGKPVIIVGY